MDDSEFAWGPGTTCIESPTGEPEVQLLIPADDETSPELSIVIPAVNEELTIGEFLAWCHEGIASAGVAAEIIIVDSGTDSTMTRALAGGARVLKTPRRGLGRAYIDAVPVARGKWILMGDADCTYDFRAILPFVERFRAGDEFVMGSRFAGSIEVGAMPWLHQKLGTPVTTWILNRVHGSHYSDIHCGMRGITTSAWERMGVRSQSWEYASEMVLKAARMGLTTSEVPVHFLRDREGRQSHHRRSGWTSPWRAAWINLREMFVYGADFFAFWPGVCFLALGWAGLAGLAAGPVTVGAVTFSLLWVFAFALLALVGLSAFSLGVLARVINDWDRRQRATWLRRLPYTRTVLGCTSVLILGVVLVTSLVAWYLGHGLSLASAPAPLVHLAVLGATLCASAFLVFVLVLVLHALVLVASPPEGPPL